MRVDHAIHLPAACQRRAPSFIRATSCRAETPTQQTAIGLAEPSTVFAVSSERSGTPERAAKRPLEVQLQPASPAETLIQPQWPVRYRSEPSNGSPQPPDRRPPRGQGAPPAAAQKQQKQRSGGKSRQGGGWMARRRNLARNVELVASKNAEEVLVIVEEQLDAFNDVNAVTAFHRLARHCHQEPPAVKAAVRGDPRTKRLALRVVAGADNWTGRIVGNVAWAHAVLQHGPPDIMDIVMEKLPTFAPHMEAVELTNALWACAKLEVDADGVFEQLIPVLIKHVRMGFFSVRVITHVVWSFATLGKYDQLLFDTCADAAAKLVDSASPQGIANLVWAYAYADALVTPEVQRLFDSVAAQAMARWRSLAAVDIANLAWAFAKVQESRGPAYGGGLTSDDEQDWALSENAWMDDDMRKFFYCLSGRLQEILARPGVHTVQDKAVSIVAWAFAVTGIRDEALFDALSAHAQQHCGSYNAQAVGTITWAYSEQKHFDDDLFEALAVRGLELLQMPRSQPADGARPAASGAVPRLAAAPGTSHKPAVPRLLHAPQAPNLWTPQLLSMTLMAYARNDCVHSLACQALLRALVEEALQQIEETDCQSLSNMAWAAACAGCMHVELLRRLQLRALELATRFSDRELKQLYQAELTLRLEAHDSLHVKLPEQLEAAEVFRRLCEQGRMRLMAARSWNADKALKSRKSSHFHQDVQTALQELGLDCETEFSADPLEYSVDLALPEQRIAIEVDGPSHFSYNTWKVDGSTALKRRLLSRQGWTVISVSFFEWDMILPWKRADFLQQKLLSAGFHVPNEGGALQRNDGGRADWENAANCVLSKAAADENPVQAECDVAALDRPALRAARHADIHISPNREVSSKNGSGAAPAAVESVGTGRMSKQDMLRYKAGLLSKHDLLVTIAKRRIASPGA